MLWAGSAACLALLNSCGSKSTANVVTVSVSPASATVIVSQSLILSATVNGATDINVTWMCQYTTTTVSNGKSTTSTPAACTSETGNIPANSTNTTVTYSAPSAVPDQTKFPGLQIIITATSAANAKATGKSTITLDSGIGVTLTPSTATVPTSEQQQFSVVLTNDLQNKGVTWLVTQATPTSTTPFPTLASCSSGCGSIDSNGLYTAPASVPTTATVTVVVTANADNTRFATGTITIITGGAITFNGISPTVAPQGGTVWDIFLDAPNISSASNIILTGPGGGITKLTSASGQVKVLFPIPTSTTANPPSTGARIRLNAENLASAGNFTVSVSDPTQTVTTSPTGAFIFTVVPIRPTSSASFPEDIPQGTLSNDVKLAIDGGYFGPADFPLANVLFAGNTLPADPTVASDARHLHRTFPASGINSGSPGLYQISVSRTSAPAPTPNNPAVTTIAVFPDYSASAPAIVSSTSAGTNPSAIDIDPTLGIAVVAETSLNRVQFFTIGTGSLTPLGAPVVVGQVPTGVSVNRTNHTVAVVNYGDQSVTVLPIPGGPSFASFTVSLAGLVPVSAPPLPYAIGVDPDTNLALVAYSSNTIPTNAKVGFIVNLNTGSNAPFGCLVSSSTPPCVFAQATLNTGTYPQIAMAPHGHLAYVTPGGSGVVLGIDVTKPSASVGISAVSLTSGVVTVTTSSAHNLNPGNPGTVLIEGVTSAAGTTANFNGAFSVLNVLNSTQFTYVLNTTLQGNGSGSGGSVFFSQPNLTFGGLPQTSQGIAINPITQTTALADANATGLNGPQLNLLNALDQSISSISFFANCTAFTTGCTHTPELLGTVGVAWQPYSDAVVSFNSQQNQVSVSNPVTRQRYAIVPVSGPSTSSINVTVGSTTNALTLWGGIAVDPVTNQAFAVKSGTGTIDVINLGPGSNSLKSVQITELLVPSPTPGAGNIGGVPNAFVPQGTLTSASDLAGVQIFGSGFVAGAQVRLDGTPLAAGNVAVDPSGRKITATIPANPYLALPHRFALDVVSGGVQSNATDFIVIKSVDMSQICKDAGGNFVSTQPSSVAVADQLATAAFSPIAVVSNSGCNSVSIIDINPGSTTFGAVKSSIAVGASPQGVAVSPRFGVAVVANHGDGTASVVNLLTGTQPVPAVTTGSNPTGVAINEGTGDALVANTGANTVSQINLAPLFGSSPPSSLTASSISVDQQPIAVSIDADRGTNNRGLAVVTALQLNSQGPATATLDLVDIGAATPSKVSSNSFTSVTATPTGIVFDPSLAIFYITSSGSNIITAFNPDGGSSSVSVGINPTSLAINPQTGAILTSNSAGKSISIVDTLANPFKTRASFGINGSPQFAVAIDQLTNLAVVVDQANNRVLLFAMPN
jgi:DNA-binding beta-propeller fold protein YncE